MKRLIKKSYHDYDSRDNALTYIDGQIYTTWTHAEAVNKYLKEQEMRKWPSNFQRPDDESLQLLGMDQSKIAFAHLREKDRQIYIDDTSLKNMTLDEAAQIFKNAYPDYSIYNDSYVTIEYEDENGIEDSRDEYPLLIAKVKKRLVRKAEAFSYGSKIDEQLTKSNHYN